MSDSTPNGAPPTDRAELEKDILETRARLASTADALASKVDVKGQAQAKVEDVKVQAAATADRAAAKVHEVSDNAPGTARQQSGVLVGVIVAATVLAVWLVVRKR